MKRIMSLCLLAFSLSSYAQIDLRIGEVRSIRGVTVSCEAYSTPAPRPSLCQHHARSSLADLKIKLVNGIGTCRARSQNGEPYVCFLEDLHGNRILTDYGDRSCMELIYTIQGMLLDGSYEANCGC